MTRIELIEALGGPLDGQLLPWSEASDCIVWTDGCRVYQYALDEVWTGASMRRVLRLVSTTPMPTGGPAPASDHE